MVRSAFGATAAVPETTVTERCGSHRSASRCQLRLRLAGQTTTAGHASSSSMAASACTVLPRPCSSARNVRRAHNTYATPARWKGRSSPPSCLGRHRRRVVRPRAADVADRRVVLGTERVEPLLRRATHLDAVGAEVVLQRLDQVRVEGERAAVRLARGQREEGRDRVRIPVDVEREARLAHAVDQRERRPGRLLPDLEAHRAAQRALVEPRAAQLEQRLGRGLRERHPARPPRSGRLQPFRGLPRSSPARTPRARRAGPPRRGRPSP